VREQIARNEDRLQQLAVEWQQEGLCRLSRSTSVPPEWPTREEVWDLERRNGRGDPCDSRTTHESVSIWRAHDLAWRLQDDRNVAVGPRGLVLHHLPPIPLSSPDELARRWNVEEGKLEHWMDQMRDLGIGSFVSADMAAVRITFQPSSGDAGAFFLDRAGPPEETAAQLERLWGPWVEHLWGPWYFSERRPSADLP
jgi:hypothetical protein